MQNEALQRRSARRLAINLGSRSRQYCSLAPRLIVRNPKRRTGI